MSLDAAAELGITVIPDAFEAAPQVLGLVAETASSATTATVGLVAKTVELAKAHPIAAATVVVGIVVGGITVYAISKNKSVDIGFGPGGFNMKIG